MFPLVMLALPLYCSDDPVKGSVTVQFASCLQEIPKGMNISLKPSGDLKDQLGRIISDENLNEGLAKPTGKKAENACVVHLFVASDGTTALILYQATERIKRLADAHLRTVIVVHFERGIIKCCVLTISN